MQLTRPTKLVYGLLLGAWLLVVAWQCEEHFRVVNAAKADLRNRSREISSTLSAVVRALRFRGTILEERLDPVLNELVYERTNAFMPSSGLLSIELLNTSGEPVAFAGDTNLVSREIFSQGEHWNARSVAFVNPIEGASVEGTNRATVVLPRFHDFTNGMQHGDFPREPRMNGDTNSPPPYPRHGPRPDDLSSTNHDASQRPDGANVGRRGPGDMPPPPEGEIGRPHGSHRPPWLRWMSDDEFKTLIARRELHGLVLVMSTENLRVTSQNDLLLRCIIALFAGLSALGTGIAWRNTLKTSELQIRLVRASELNSHLKAMNLAAAGLAHETRNPLNIIRGHAQMLFKQTDAPADIREKSRIIMNETDKVTAQLTEFINYSRPREVRRVNVSLNAVAADVLRTLAYDIEDKNIKVETIGDPLTIEADEQMLRQVLFNLMINSIQAVGTKGTIQVRLGRDNTGEGVLEVADDGPGIPPEQRREVFKPYFTTNKKGTGLGLAVVQQIVLAHGWEIECLGNIPKGALFRISHLKIVS